MPQQKIIRNDCTLDRPSNYDRQEEDADIQSVILCHMIERGPSWATSREIACEMGFPWRKVARALLKMAEVEKREWNWVSNKFRTRTCWIYRHVSAPTAIYPEWMMPRAQEVEIGIGFVHRVLED